MPKARTDLPIPAKPKGQVPHLFGRGMRDRLLLLLAVNDRPVYVAEVASALRSDSRKVRQTLAVLTDIGVVAATNAGPMSIRFMALNAAFPAYPWLLRFLRVLEERWPQQRLLKPARAAERLALRGLNVAGSVQLANIDNLFYSTPRTRALLCITAMGTTDVTDIAETIGLDKRSTWNVINQLQREGVVRSSVSGRRRVVELNPEYSAARELKLLLRRLVALTGEYEGYARLSTRRPGSPRFVSLR